MADTKMLKAIMDRINIMDKKIDRVEVKIDKNGDRMDKLGSKLLTWKMMHQLKKNLLS